MYSLGKNGTSKAPPSQSAQEIANKTSIPAKAMGPTNSTTAIEFRPVDAAPNMTNEEKLLQKAFMYSNSAQYDYATEIYGQMLSADPSNYTLLILYADALGAKCSDQRLNALERTKSFSSAYAQYSEAIALMPKNPLAYARRAELQSKSRLYSGALSDYEAAKKADELNKELYLPKINSLKAFIALNQTLPDGGQNKSYEPKFFGRIGAPQYLRQGVSSFMGPGGEYYCENYAQAEGFLDWAIFHDSNCAEAYHFKGMLQRVCKHDFYRDMTYQTIALSYDENNTQYLWERMNAKLAAFGPDYRDMDWNWYPKYPSKSYPDYPVMGTCDDRFSTLPDYAQVMWMPGGPDKQAYEPIPAPSCGCGGC